MSITPTVKVQLDRERRLSFPYGSIIALEEATGRSIVELTQEEYLVSARGVRDFVWAGLLHEDPDLTREQVADMLSFDRIAEMQNAVVKALNESMPQAKGGRGKTARPPKASRRTG